MQNNIYIIGIGGKGLNSIAEFCHLNGYKVSGSDCKESLETQSLISRGCAIYYDQSGIHITKAFDCVVYSSVILESHPELIRARELGVKTMNRAQFLGHITSQYKRISIAGSHGKSTTSALTTLAIKAARGNINAITGAYIKELKSYQSVGDSPFCVLEACEYSKSFLEIPGDYTVITALEKSHMEYFKNEESMNLAFSEFISKHKQDATLIINGDTPKLRELASIHKKTITCGFNVSNEYVIKDVVLEKEYSSFSIYKNGYCIEENVEIKIPGKYNILNVALTFVLLHTLKMSTLGFRKVLENFKGVGRRFEISYLNDTVFVDDFAHHPTQVKNLLSGLKQFFPDKKICAIFEPRQYHLIKTFLKEYGKSFKLADEVFVTDIVPALGDTKEDIESLSTEEIIKNVKVYSRPKELWYARSYQEIVNRLNLKDLSNTVVTTIGAGSIFRVRDLLANRVQ